MEAPEATTTSPQPTTESKRKSAPNPDRVRAVLETVSLERLANERTIVKTQASYRARDQTWAERLVPLRKAKAEADADLKAHDRYKHQMTPQEWAEERRELLAAQAAAGKQLEKVQEECNTDMAKRAEPLRELQEKRAALTNEWDAHVRRAQKIGIDTDEYWTPAMGLPTEAEVEDAATELDAPADAPPAAEEPVAAAPAQG